jgi:predicted nucleic acid-binding Zn ribbon protein
MEVFHPVHGQGPSACPRCGGEMRKAFAPPTVHFKGTGWARKDRSAGSHRTKGSDEGAEKPADKPKAEKASDAGSTASGDD